MKVINYRGGLIKFRIPQKWIEEYEDAGGGTFYEDHPESGTLRVNVLTIEANQENDNIESTYEDIKSNSETRKYYSTHGDVIFENMERSEENGIPITISNFTCIHQTIRKDYLMAYFTWTIETRFENEHQYMIQLDSIRENIIQIEFGR